MYEYRILKTDTPEVSEKQLNEFGANRWMLQCVVQWNGYYYYYFIRTKMSG